jgi:hypothetical protein
MMVTAVELRSAPSETKWPDKNTGTPDRIPSNPAISRQDVLSGVRRWSIPEHDTRIRSVDKGIWLYKLFSLIDHFVLIILSNVIL